MLRAFHLVDDYAPDSRYFPLSKKIASLVQKILLFLSLISPSFVNIIDRLVTRLVFEKMEGNDSFDLENSELYGNVEEIDKREHLNIPKDERYFGIVRKKTLQYAWRRGIHTGSIDPDRGGTESFGTYDIALNLGFTDEQARRIAKECFDVDTNETHYHDPDDRTKPRITGVGSRDKKGDFHRHYNMCSEGSEDTRITAAKIHLNRALKLAKEGFYDSAERELGIGLHSLQDIFSHVQITPLNHALLGEFPDLSKYHPLALYETEVATEGYLKKFIERLDLTRSDQPAVLQHKFKFSDSARRQGKIVFVELDPHEYFAGR